MKRIGHRIFLLLSSVRVKKLCKRNGLSVCLARKQRPSILALSCRLNRLNRWSGWRTTPLQILCQNMVSIRYIYIIFMSYVFHPRKINKWVEPEQKIRSNTILEFNKEQNFVTDFEIEDVLLKLWPRTWSMQYSNADVFCNANSPFFYGFCLRIITFRKNRSKNCRNPQ